MSISNAFLCVFQTGCPALKCCAWLNIYNYVLFLNDVNNLFQTEACRDSISAGIRWRGASFGQGSGHPANGEEGLNGLPCADVMHAAGEATGQAWPRQLVQAAGWGHACRNFSSLFHHHRRCRADCVSDSSSEVQARLDWRCLHSGERYYILTGHRLNLFAEATVEVHQTLYGCDDGKRIIMFLCLKLLSGMKLARHRCVIVPNPYLHSFILLFRRNETDHTSSGCDGYNLHAIEANTHACKLTLHW